MSGSTGATDATGSTGSTGGTDALALPVWAALTGPHAGLGDAHGAARRYRADVASFADVDPDAGPEAWRDLCILQPSAERTIVFGPAPWSGLDLPGWEVALEFAGTQLVAGPVAPTAADDVVALGPADLADMRDLVACTEPGPFGPGALRMGRFLGVRRDGRLVAMAGERLRQPGWVEISAVCTDPAARGEGLAGRLVTAAVAAIRARGEEAYLHVSATNTSAQRLYERLGFTVVRPMWFAGLRRVG